jgi:hypothetical protein
MNELTREQLKKIMGGNVPEDEVCEDGGDEEAFCNPVTCFFKSGLRNGHWASCKCNRYEKCMCCYVIVE